MQPSWVEDEIIRAQVTFAVQDAVVSPLKTEPFATFGYALYVPRSLAGSPHTIHRWLPQLPMISPTEGWTCERVDAAAEAAGLLLRIDIEGSKIFSNARNPQIFRKGIAARQAFLYFSRHPLLHALARSCHRHS
ncbi:MAG: hypothetical protein WDN28_08465 [Chthoniobacter sp.]